METMRFQKCPDKLTDIQSTKSTLIALPMKQEMRVPHPGCGTLPLPTVRKQLKSSFNMGRGGLSSLRLGNIQRIGYGRGQVTMAKRTPSIRQQHEDASVVFKP